MHAGTQQQPPRGERETAKQLERTREPHQIRRDLQEPPRASRLSRLIARIERREHTSAKLCCAIPAAADRDANLGEFATVEAGEVVAYPRPVPNPVVPLVWDDGRQAGVDVFLLARVQGLVLGGEDAQERVCRHVWTWLVDERGVVCDGAI